MADDPYVTRWLVLAAVAAAAITATVTPAPAADQASITRTAWWTRNPVASAPDGGLDVSMGPDGAPLSIAAIEVAASGTVTRAVLTLAEATGISQEGAALVVCTTGDEWTSGPSQPIEDAPSPACNGSVAMTRNAASATWAADVTPLLRDVARDGSASLMVVPVASAAAPLGFDLQLRAPQLQSEVTRGASPAATTTSTTSPPSSGTTAPPSPPPSTPSPATTGSDGFDPAVAAAGRAAVESTTTTSTTTAPSPAEEAAVRTVTQPRPISPPPPEDGPLPGPWWQVALAVLIGDLLVLGRQLAQRAQRASIGTYSRLSGPA